MADELNQSTSQILEPEVMDKVNDANNIPNANSAGVNSANSADDDILGPPKRQNKGLDGPIVTFSATGRLPAMHANHREKMSSYAGRLADAMTEVEENTHGMVEMAEMMAKESRKRKEAFEKQLKESGM